MHLTQMPSRSSELIALFATGSRKKAKKSQLRLQSSSLLSDADAGEAVGPPLSSAKAEGKMPSGLILKGGRVRLPDKLIEYLNKNVAPNVLWWQTGGETFSFDSTKAQEHLLDRYFNETKLSSFTRSLNRWGFKRIFLAGQSKKILTYEHPLFKRDEPLLVREMKMAGHSNDDHAARDEPEESVVSEQKKAAAASASASAVPTLPTTASPTSASGSSVPSSISVSLPFQVPGAGQASVALTGLDAVTAVAQAPMPLAASSEPQLASLLVPSLMQGLLGGQQAPPNNNAASQQQALLVALQAINNANHQQQAAAASSYLQQTPNPDVSFLAQTLLAAQMPSQHLQQAQLQPTTNALTLQAINANQQQPAVSRNLHLPNVDFSSLSQALLATQMPTQYAQAHTAGNAGPTNAMIQAILAGQLQQAQAPPQPQQPQQQQQQAHLQQQPQAAATTSTQNLLQQALQNAASREQQQKQETQQILLALAMAHLQGNTGANNEGQDQQGSAGQSSS
jgi:hypothetical protein